jgi:hypothetical protein
MDPLSSFTVRIAAFVVNFNQRLSSSLNADRDRQATSNSVIMVIYDLVMSSLIVF